jgi:hypothetical protein
VEIKTERKKFYCVVPKANFDREDLRALEKSKDKKVESKNIFKYNDAKDQTLAIFTDQEAAIKVGESAEKEYVLLSFTVYDEKEQGMTQLSREEGTHLRYSLKVILTDQKKIIRTPNQGKEIRLDLLAEIEQELWSYFQEKEKNKNKSDGKNRSWNYLGIIGNAKLKLEIPQYISEEILQKQSILSADEKEKAKNRYNNLIIDTVLYALFVYMRGEKLKNRIQPLFEKHFERKVNKEFLAENLFLDKRLMGSVSLKEHLEQIQNITSYETDEDIAEMQALVETIAASFLFLDFNQTLEKKISHIKQKKNAAAASTSPESDRLILDSPRRNKTEGLANFSQKLPALMGNYLEKYNPQPQWDTIKRAKRESLSTGARRVQILAAIQTYNPKLETEEAKDRLEFMKNVALFSYMLYLPGKALREKLCSQFLLSFNINKINASSTEILKIFKEDILEPEYQKLKGSTVGVNDFVQSMVEIAKSFAQHASSPVSVKEVASYCYRTFSKILLAYQRTKNPIKNGQLVGDRYIHNFLKRMPAIINSYLQKYNNLLTWDALDDNQDETLLRKGAKKAKILAKLFDPLIALYNGHGVLDTSNVAERVKIDFDKKIALYAYLLYLPGQELRQRLCLEFFAARNIDVPQKNGVRFASSEPDHQAIHKKIYEWFTEMVKHHTPKNTGKQADFIKDIDKIAKKFAQDSDTKKLTAVTIHQFTEGVKNSVTLYTPKVQLSEGESSEWDEDYDPFAGASAATAPAPGGSQSGDES